MKIIKYFFEALIIYLFFLIIKILGLKNSRKIFSFIFIKVGPLIKSKKIVEENIFRVFGNQIDSKQITKSMWSNYGKTFVEYLFLKKYRDDSFKEKQIEIKGLETLIKIKKNKNPVIFISGHFANFELMSMELTKNEVNLATIYRPLNNIFVNPFMEFLRKKFICKNQIKKGISGIRDSMEYLKNKHSIALMIDQRLSEGKKLPFFKEGALTTTLPAQLALKYNCDIVPVYLKRNSNDTFELEIYNPIDVSKMDKNENSKINISLELNKIIEKMILKNPGQWIWTHNRWK
ncbi:MAG: lipid A biosynthesis acyltransferase [Pelagibacteraceae bacterium TMED287]|nr:MAG: lipid A biosynthesis acyltransferase [Pelagibacteraceae bacterium TMED287]